MKMLRYSGLAVLVVCIAAFASGCGGGGGGGTADDMTTVMECPQGQIGTYPDCMDPPPTDEQRIEAAQDTLAGIVADARTRVGAAQSDANAVQGHADATEAQKTNAGNLGNAARDALTDILGATAAANVATTGAQAETAVSDARTALNDLISAEQSVANILSAVNAIANLRQQQEQDERLATNGSSLIEHVRDNRKVFDEVLGNLGDSSITVGTASSGANDATYPSHTGSPRTVYPRPSDAERGVLGVTITVGGTAVSSSGLTDKLSGTGRLSQGLDVKDGSLFVNAYTDIAVDRRVSSGIADDPGTTDRQEQYVYAADTDYLLAGIWLNDSSATPSLGAFAYGSENITTDARASSLDRCSAAQGTSPNACTEATGFHQITNFVSAGNELNATYRGGASGAYLAGGLASHFTANVELTAVFRNVDDTNVTGSNIKGEVTNIVAGGKSISGSIDLISHPLGNDISGPFEDDSNVDPAAVGVIAGDNYSGRWTGQFFGKRTKSSPTSVANNNDGRDYTYQPDAPNSVAGTFYVIKQSAPAGDAAFLGSFGAYR